MTCCKDSEKVHFGEILVGVGKQEHILDSSRGKMALSRRHFDNSHHTCVAEKMLFIISVRRALPTSQRSKSEAGELSLTDVALGDEGEAQT